MRKNIVFTLMIFVLTIILVGCGKEGLVGSWQSEAYSGAYVYTFNADGTGIYNASGNKMEFTYTTDGEKISILYPGNTVPFESTYKIDGNSLNIVDSFGKDTIYKRK